MRGYSLVLVLLVGAVLASATAHRRRSVDDRDAENQVDSAERSAERPEPVERYRHYNYHQHHHGRRQYFGRLDRRGFNISQAEEVIEFHRHFMHDVRRLATASDLSSSDINTLMNIFEENRSPFKREDRSQWTEEQWQKSKEERNQRRQLISAQAFEQIPDRAHLVVFFQKLEAEKKQIRENINKRILTNLIWIAKRSGLSKAQTVTFIRELENHKPVGLHWRPGMSENEKKKNLQIRLKNWQEIKEACLQDASEPEQMQFNRFFARVEQEFAKHAEGGHPRRMSHQHHRRPFHPRHYRQDQNDDEGQSFREHRRRYRYDANDNNNNDDSNEMRSERHQLRRYRGRRDFDGEDVEESPRHYHARRQYRRSFRHENDVEDTPSMRFRHYRRHPRRDSEQSEERDVPRRGDRRHELDDSEETEQEEAPSRYNRYDRHHHHHHHKHHHHDHPKRQPESTNDSEEQRDNQRDEAPRHRYRYRNHYRRHESEENDDAKARFEREPLPARHIRRGDGAPQE